MGSSWEDVPRERQPGKWGERHVCLHRGREDPEQQRHDKSGREKGGADVLDTDSSPESAGLCSKVMGKR